MSKKILLLGMVLLGTVLLGACTGAVRGSSWPGLAADENVVYLADGPAVYAVDLKSGTELWHYPAKANAKLVFYAPPVLTQDGLVIVGSAGTDHELIAIDPTDIDPETNSPVAAWTFTEAGDHWVAAPLIIGDKLYAPNSDGNLYILNLNDGQSQKKAEQKILMVNPNDTQKKAGRLWSTPVTDGSKLFITSLDHSVFGMDLATYKYWHQDLEGAIPGAPVIGSDGMIYVGSLAAHLEKFDPANGNHQTAMTAKNWIWSTPVADGDALYFGDLDGNFYSYNTSTGELNWSIQPDGPITASAIVQNDHLLILTESGNIYAIGKDGSTLWFDTIGGQLYSTPVVSGDLILVAPLGADFYLTALNSDGRQVWTFAPGK